MNNMYFVSCGIKNTWHRIARSRCYENGMWDSLISLKIEQETITIIRIRLRKEIKPILATAIAFWLSILCLSREYSKYKSTIGGTF